LASKVSSLWELRILEIALNPCPLQLDEERTEVTDINMIKQLHIYRKNYSNKKIKLRNRAKFYYGEQRPFFSINLNRSKLD